MLILVFCKQDFAEPAHIVMTYTAILNLAILGDDLTRLNHKGLIAFVASCQTEDGRYGDFFCTIGPS